MDMAFGLCPEDWVVVYLSWSLKKGQFTLRGYLKMRKSGGAPWFIKWGVWFLNLFIPVWFFFFLDWTYFSSLIFWKTLKWKRKKKYILIQRTLKSYSQLLVTLFFSSKISISSLSSFFFFLLVISDLTFISRMFDIYLSIFTIAALKSLWDNSSI